MPAAKLCPNCQAEVSPFAPSCPACKSSLSGRAPLARTPKAASTPARPEAARSVAGASVALAPAERRSLAIGQMSLQAGAIALWSVLYALDAVFGEGKGPGLLTCAIFAAGFGYTAWAGSQCQPLGRMLLMGHSALVFLAFPIGTLQSFFQFSHLTKPEASLIFSGRDRFTPDEARDIGVFREANPNLTAWVRILNLISLLVLALVFFVGLIARI